MRGESVSSKQPCHPPWVEVPVPRTRLPRGCECLSSLLGLLVMTRRARLWAPAWAMMGLIFGLSSMSQLPRVPGAFEDDGVAHAVAYGVLAALLLRGLTGACWHRV